MFSFQVNTMVQTQVNKVDVDKLLGDFQAFAKNPSSAVAQSLIGQLDALKTQAPALSAKIDKAKGFLEAVPINIDVENDMAKAKTNASEAYSLAKGIVSDYNKSIQPNKPAKQDNQFYQQKPKKSDFPFWYTGKISQGALDWADAQLKGETFGGKGEERLKLLLENNPELLRNLLACVKMMDKSFGGYFELAGAKEISFTTAKAYLRQALDELTDEKYGIKFLDAEFWGDAAKGTAGSFTMHTEAAALLQALLTFEYRAAFKPKFLAALKNKTLDEAYGYLLKNGVSEFAKEQFAGSKINITLYTDLGKTMVARAEILSAIKPTVQKDQVVSGQLQDEYASLGDYKLDPRVADAARIIGVANDADYEGFKSSNSKYSVTAIQGVAMSALAIENSPGFYSYVFALSDMGFNGLENALLFTDASNSAYRTAGEIEGARKHIVETLKLPLTFQNMDNVKSELEKYYKSSKNQAVQGDMALGFEYNSLADYKLDPRVADAISRLGIMNDSDLDTKLDKFASVQNGVKAYSVTSIQYDLLKKLACENASSSLYIGAYSTLYGRGGKTDFYTDAVTDKPYLADALYKTADGSYRTADEIRAAVAHIASLNIPFTPENIPEIRDKIVEYYGSKNVSQGNANPQGKASISLNVPDLKKTSLAGYNRQPGSISDPSGILQATPPATKKTVNTDVKKTDNIEVKKTDNSGVKKNKQDEVIIVNNPTVSQVDKKNKQGEEKVYEPYEKKDETQGSYATIAEAIDKDKTINKAIDDRAKKDNGMRFTIIAWLVNDDRFKDKSITPSEIVKAINEEYPL